MLLHIVSKLKAFLNILQTANSSLAGGTAGFFYETLPAVYYGIDEQL